MPRPAKPMLGLDISSSAVKLIELSKPTDTYRVEACSLMPLPANTVVEKNIIDIEGLADTIAKVVSKSKTQCSAAAVAVSGACVITKEIELPRRLTELQMKKQIELEAGQYIPYPLEEIALDFDILGPVQSNTNLVRVLLAACRQENIEQRCQALEMAGLTAKVIDIEVFAVERAYKLIRDQLNRVGDRLVAIADIGASMITFTVLIKGRAIYSAEELFGSKQLTDEVQRRYQVSFEQAIDENRNERLPNSYETEIHAPFRASLIKHIARSLQFFYSSSQYSNIDRIFLVGGGSTLDNLATELEHTLGLPAVNCNPMATLQVNQSSNRCLPVKHGPTMMVALGLALRCFA